MILSILGTAFKPERYAVAATRPPPDPQSAEEVAAYVETMTRDLAGLSRSHGLDILAYLLDLAKLEAQNITRKYDLNE